MAKIYAKLVQIGARSIDDVPENLREEVCSILEGLEYLDS